MNWQTVVEAIGIFGVGSGLLAWLIRSLVKQALDRDIEIFKHELRKAHEIQMEEAKNRFTVGATSHMADVAFDKHVQFCEEYAKGVNGTLDFLFKKGPHKDVLNEANNLADIRAKGAVWLPPKVDGELFKFEGALRTIGANAWLLGELGADVDRTEAIKAAYGTFAAVVGWETWQGETVTQDLAAERVVQKLRNVLGIDELTWLRAELVKRAVDNLRETAGQVE
jgi:hypothetical protein